MTVYIVCPANRITGGVELAHQLCYAINALTDVKAIMWYIDIDHENVEAIVVNQKAPKDYAAYNTTCVAGFYEIDNEKNVIVFTEGLTYYMELIDHAKKVLWWMSVDNYIEETGEENINDIAQSVKFNLYQSYYAMDYVKCKIPNARGMFLSDYINEEHGRFMYPVEFRKNLALYNPRKGYDRIEHLIKKANWLEWVPLLGMTREKMILVMQISKIYVDFGHHPGKDRIPREAAANGCCVITNKKGSAAYSQDVPIPDGYKFDDPIASLDEIDVLMHEICDNFADHMKDFDSYREMIKSEKAKFDKDVITFVEEIKSW